MCSYDINIRDNSNDIDEYFLQFEFPINTILVKGEYINFEAVKFSDDNDFGLGSHKSKFLKLFEKYSEVFEVDRVIHNVSGSNPLVRLKPINKI